MTQMVQAQGQFSSCTKSTAYLPDVNACGARLPGVEMPSYCRGSLRDSTLGPFEPADLIAGYAFGSTCRTPK